MFQSFKVARAKKAVEKQGLPSFLESYLQQYPSRPRANTPLSELRFVVFDTEATGLDFRKDRLLSLGSVAVCQSEIWVGDSLSLLIANENAANEAVPIHGIVPSESHAGKSEGEAVQAFIEQLGNSVMVAHHAWFDVHMMQKALQRQFHPRLFLYNPVLDTMQLAKKLLQPGASAEEIKTGMYGLDDLCERYAIPTHDRHTAWGDAFITAQLLLILVRRLHQAGSRTLGDLLR
jgi:DNA polymerase-3 subunit epsilon